MTSGEQLRIARRLGAVSLLVALVSVAVLVADLPSVVEELRSHGLSVDDAVQVGADLQTFVRDPDGNTVELHQVGV